VGADDDDGQLGLEQRIHDRPVRPLNGNLGDAQPAQLTHEVAQAGSGVSDGESLNDLATGVDHRDGVIIPCPVQACGLASRAGSNKSLVWRMLHLSLLAASASGEAPSYRYRAAAAGSLTVRRSMALSPVDGRRVPGNHRVSQISTWTSTRQAGVAMTRRHRGCIGSRSTTTDQRRVHQ
jgi:hypothetical protein